jgi:hypothetical protein
MEVEATGMGIVIVTTDMGIILIIIFMVNKVKGSNGARGFLDPPAKCRHPGRLPLLD